MVLDTCDVYYTVVSMELYSIWFKKLDIAIFLTRNTFPFLKSTLQRRVTISIVLRCTPGQRNLCLRREVVVALSV